MSICGRVGQDLHGYTRQRGLGGPPPGAFPPDFSPPASSPRSSSPPVISHPCHYPPGPPPPPPPPVSTKSFSPALFPRPSSHPVFMLNPRDRKKQNGVLECHALLIKSTVVNWHSNKIQSIVKQASHWIFHNAIVHVFSWPVLPWGLTMGNPTATLSITTVRRH